MMEDSDAVNEGLGSRGVAAPRPSARYIFLDLETTGLESGVDQITEAAWITDDGRVRQFFVEHDRLPNEWVLQNTDYLTRIALAAKDSSRTVLSALRKDCQWLGDSGASVHLVGACIAFDDRFLRAAYRRELEGVPYHYHVIDVEAMALGALSLPTMPPLKELREALGIPGENEAAHTALADAREVKLIFDALRSRGKARLTPVERDALSDVFEHCDVDRYVNATYVGFLRALLNEGTAAEAAEERSAAHSDRT